jgi:hypothetical protein
LVDDVMNNCLLFHMTAGCISLYIASTSNILKDLTQHIRQKSILQDDTPRVKELVVLIKASIENLNGHSDAAGEQNPTLGKSTTGDLTSWSTWRRIWTRRSRIQDDTTTTDQDAEKDHRSVRTSMVLTRISMCRIWKIDHRCLNTIRRGVAGCGGSDMGAAGFLTLDLSSRMAASEPSGSSTSSVRYLIGKPNSIVDPPFQERAKSLVFYSQSLSITKRSASGFDALSMRLRHCSTSDFVSTSSGSLSSYYGRKESIPLTLWDMQRIGQESGQDPLMWVSQV